jgi:ATP-dependent protease ClpP protease subunit
MKRIIMAGLMLFTFACAPQIQGLRSKTAANDEPTVPASIQALLDAIEEPKAAPKLECPDKLSCVLQYRMNDEVTQTSAKEAIDWINAANEAGATDIVFEINTPGGSVPAGFELAKTIENSKAPVSMVVDWEAASMGAFLLESAHNRYMTKRSMLMFHEPSLGGAMSGTPNQWQAIADMLKAMRIAIAVHCSARMNVTLDYYMSKTDGGQMWFLNGDEAMATGAVDQVVDSVAQVVRSLKMKASMP